MQRNCPYNCRQAEFISTSIAVHWQNVTLSATWSPRYGQSACELNGKLFLMAGLTPAATNEIWVSADHGLTWTKSGSGTAGWTPRAFASLTSWQGAMYIFGGTNLQGSMNDFYMSEDGVSWKQLQRGHVSLTPRSVAPMVSFGGRLWLFPGIEGPEGGIWWTTPSGETWQEASSGIVFGNLRQYGVAALGGSLLATGGYAIDSQGIAVYESKVFNSTINLFCEADGKVCGAHGYCTGSAHGEFHATKCHCEENYKDSTNCTVKDCQEGANCIHGKCVNDKIVDLAGAGPAGVTPWSPVHQGAAGEYARVLAGLALAAPTPDPPQHCECDDGWKGSRCNKAICRDNCKHGDCKGLPYSCKCKPKWRGRLCDIRETPFERLGHDIMENGSIVFGIATTLFFGVAVALAVYENYWLRRSSLARMGPRRRGRAKRSLGFDALGDSMRLLSTDSGDGDHGGPAGPLGREADADGVYRGEFAGSGAGALLTRPPQGVAGAGAMGALEQE